MPSWKSMRKYRLYAQNTEHQSIQHKAVQIKKRGEYNVSYPAAELERTSLWLDRGKKYIYLHSYPWRKAVHLFEPGQQEYVPRNSDTERVRPSVLGYKLHSFRKLNKQRLPRC